MIGNGTLIVRTTILCMATIAMQLAAQEPPAPQAPRPVPQSASDAGIDAGLALLRNNQPEKALAVFQRVLAVDPDNASANLLAASAALNAYQGALAVAYAEKAQQLVPNDWKIDTTLVAAYAVASDTKKRDAERAKLRKLHDDPQAADAMKANGFLLDVFHVNEYRVEVVEYFKPIGKFHLYYRFVVRNKAGRRVWEYDLQSDDFTQKSWAEAHPENAASGGRQYELESDTSDTHTEYRLFSGDPGYDAVRAVVVQLLSERTSPFPSETVRQTPAVQ